METQIDNWCEKHEIDNWIENTKCVNSHRPIITEEERKEWFKKNNEKLRERVRCECGNTVSRGQLKRHKKTKKHFNNLSHYKI